MSDILTKNIVLLRITIIKEKKDYYTGKDSNGNKCKLLKENGSKQLKVGDDSYHYVEKLGSTLLFKNVLRLLSKKEEYELLNNNQLPSLHELGINLSNL